VVIGGVRRAATMAVASFAFMGLSTALPGSAPLTPEAAVETTRVLEDYDVLTSGATPVSISPDQKTILIRLVQGDIQTNTVMMTVLGSALDSAGAVSSLHSVAVLHSSGLGAKDSIIGPWVNSNPNYNRIAWLDGRHVAFIWSDPQGVNQVVSLDLDDGHITARTHHSTQVMNFAIGSDGSILYTAQAPHDQSSSQPLLRSGFVVPERSDFYGLLRGFLDGTSLFDLYWNSNWYLQRSPSAKPLQIKVGGHDQDLSPFSLLKISPDSRYALVSAAGFGAPTSWSSYKGKLQRLFVDAISSRNTSAARNVASYFVLDMQSGSTRRLWNAPQNLDDDVSWAPDSRKVLITGTYLPVDDADEAGRAGAAVAVVDTTNGTYEKLPVTTLRDAYFHGIWHSQDLVEIQSQSRERTSVDEAYFHKDKSWNRAIGPGDSQKNLGVTFELRQTLTTPPAIYARNQRTGKETLLLDPNPHLLDRFALGNVQYLTGTLPSGDVWQATVYYPTNYLAGRRYPLVIQSDYGVFPTANFSLYGLRDAGTGPSPIAPSVAQMLANRQIMVVEASVRAKDHQSHFETEAPRNQAAWETIVRMLDRKGMIDKTRVGISGFSRNGYYIEYALTHSRFPWAAAIAADNYDPSYMTAGIALKWDIQNSDSNGAPPFGKGLDRWLKAAPGFNVEKIRSPLMLEAQTGGITALSWFWEILSRLEYLHYPVELWAIPDYEHAIHNTQNPRQILAVEHRVIDWFEFWLTGYEDSDSNKRAQYAHWERLCDMHKTAHPGVQTYCVQAR
jgi:dipeptidyl aminopeptidase/acylaminoacyl peptidase